MDVADLIPKLLPEEQRTLCKALDKSIKFYYFAR